jgi:hypothetical protein
MIVVVVAEFSLLNTVTVTATTIIDKHNNMSSLPNINNNNVNNDTISEGSDIYKEDYSPFIDNNINSEYDSDEDSSVQPPTEDVAGDIDLEIVGLLCGSNGRSCSVHSECGSSVRVGDLLRLKKTVVIIDGQEEEAVKLLKITEDGVEGCTVGFIPKVQAKTTRVTSNIDCFCRVKEIYAHSSSAYKRQKAHRNYGMAGAVLLKENSAW